MAINPSQDILKNALTPLQPGGFVQNKDIPVQNQSKQTYLPQKPVVTPPAQPISQKHTVTFSNGATVTFDGIPTKADIDHVASTDAVKNYKNPEASAPPPTPTFQDQHPTEGGVMQTLKAVPRAGLDFLKGAANDVVNIAGGIGTVAGNTFDAGKAILTGNWQTTAEANKAMEENKSGFLRATSGGTGLLTDLVPATAATKIGYNVASQLPAVQYVPQAINAGVGLVNKGIEATGVKPEDAQNITNIASNVALLKGGAKGQAEINAKTGFLPKAIEAAKQVPQTTLETAKVPFQLIKALTPTKAFDINDYIQTKYETGVKPSLSNVKQPNYEKNVLGAVKTITEVKPTIKDQFGETTNALPKNLNEFRDAIDQTKTDIFNKYDALQKEAGGKGATINLSSVAEELNKIANDAVVKDTNPSVADYAEKASERFSNRGEYTTQQAQDAIKAYNTSLNAFYKNPTYENASKASIDAMIVSNLRASLDSSIEKSGGKGYQDLKTKYGQLKSIENDVVKRALVDARKNAKGLLDFTDIATGAEVIKSILTLDPTAFATGVGAKLIKEYYKYLNDPNTSIKQLFNEAKGNLGKIGIKNEPLQSLKTGLKNAGKNLGKLIPKKPSQ